jgi:hypothetical protein
MFIYDKAKFEAKKFDIIVLVKQRLHGYFFLN